MQNINRFLVLGLIAAAAVFVTGLAAGPMNLLQQADAAQCKQNLVAVCGVCVQANVIAKAINNCDT